ncbi:MAG: hypothetical protein Q8K86_09030 [Candidatus Nanopelagicaceae bacterium]|nr:hypothetical protein [Candidatus Nanopelagicaceae bacterium]
MADPQFRQFDVVQIITTKNIKFCSGPKNRPATPHGNWTVIGFVKSDLMLAKDSTVVLAPLDAVRRVAAYDLESFFDKVKKTRKIPNEERSKTPQGSGKPDRKVE